MKMKKSSVALIIVVLSCVIFGKFYGDFTNVFSSFFDEENSSLQAAKVVRIVDGDTLVVLFDGKNHKVRLIGIDAPESAGDYKDSPESYGVEASEFTESLMAGKTIYLEKDVSETDRFGRLLRYVWMTDEISEDYDDLLNAKLLEEGLAELMTMKPDTKYAKVFEQIENEAKKDGQNIWE